MTALKRLILETIAIEGPMPVDRYMALCLAHPTLGYYQTRDPLGAGGDFVTSPEISQIFGELIGVWSATAWRAMGSPSRFRLVELGPGRGTLMTDLLRAAAKAPGFSDAAEVSLVETSRALREAQRRTLGPAAARAEWFERIEDVPEAPTILIANEFLDCLPVRQFERRAGEWRERLIGAEDDRLFFGLAATPATDFAGGQAPERAVLEIQPGVAMLVAAIAARKPPTAALFVDYGHARSGFGDTLQALQNHRFVDPLLTPGEADVTVHVDFARLARLAMEAGLFVSCVLTQRDFLLRLGLEARLATLAKARPDRAEALTAGAQRLIDPASAGMGALFKVLALSSPPLLSPPFEDD